MFWGGWFLSVWYFVVFLGFFCTFGVFFGVFGVLKGPANLGFSSFVVLGFRVAFVHAFAVLLEIWYLFLFCFRFWIDSERPPEHRNG